MNIDDLIRESLRAAADETKLPDEKKVEILLNTLTVFLKKQIEPDEKR